MDNQLSVYKSLLNEFSKVAELIFCFFFVIITGYGIGSKAPGIKETGTKDYIASHNQLRSHARAYRLYERKYKSTQNGIIDIL